MVYINILFNLTLIFLILISLFTLVDQLAGAKSSDMVKSDSPFECGVSSDHSSRISFSLPFFLTSVVFLMFDVEVMLLFPSLFMDMSIKIWLNLIFFLLLFGLWLEWSLGSLNWKF